MTGKAAATPLAASAKRKARMAYEGMIADTVTITGDKTPSGRPVKPAARINRG
jgi:hypothetical protein